MRAFCLFTGMLGSWALGTGQGRRCQNGKRVHGAVDTMRVAVLPGGLFHRTGTC